MAQTYNERRRNIIHEEVLLRWLGSRLGVAVKTLSKFKDGRFIESFVNKISQGNLKKYLNRKVKPSKTMTAFKKRFDPKKRGTSSPDDRAQQRVHYVLKYLEKDLHLPMSRHKMEMAVLSGSADILDLLESLVWHFDIKLKLGCSGDTREEFLEWVNGKLSEDLQSQNFEQDWRDGLRLGAFLNQYDKDWCSEWQSWDHENGFHNLKTAMDIAAEVQGISQILGPAEMNFQGTPEICVITYLSQFLSIKEPRRSTLSEQYRRESAYPEDGYQEFHPKKTEQCSSSSHHRPTPTPRMTTQSEQCRGPKAEPTYVTSDEADSDYTEVYDDIIAESDTEDDADDYSYLDGDEYPNVPEKVPKDKSDTDDADDYTYSCIDRDEYTEVPEKVLKDSEHTLPSSLEPTMRACASEKRGAKDINETEISRRNWISDIQALRPPDTLELDKHDVPKSGNVGDIYLARLYDEEIGLSMVAAKTARDKKDEIHLLKEAALMMKLKHENVMNLYGLVLMEDKVYLLQPWMVNGDLKTYLQDNSSSIKEEPLFLFALDVACAMEYLAERNIVHRDLAARNCLLDRVLRVKISDFTLSRDIFIKPYIRKSDMEMPFQNAALEVLEHLVIRCTFMGNS